MGVFFLFKIDFSSPDKNSANDPKVDVNTPWHLIIEP